MERTTITHLPQPSDAIVLFDTLIGLQNQPIMRTQDQQEILRWCCPKVDQISQRIFYESQSLLRLAQQMRNGG